MTTSKRNKLKRLVLTLGSLGDEIDHLAFWAMMQVKIDS
jgi:hypothetical protein